MSETLTCSIDATRVSAAFNVLGEVWFNDYQVLVDGDDGSYGVWVACENGLSLWLDASDNMPYFSLGTEPNENESSYCFTRDGTYELIEISHVTINVLCRGFYCLGLLTPYVENGLKVAISAHQKLEWRLEFCNKHPVELWPASWREEGEKTNVQNNP